MRRGESLQVEKDDRLHPLILPDSGLGSVAILMIGEVNNDIDLKFYDKESLSRFIAALMSMQQEWDRMGKETEEFAAETVGDGA